MVADNIECSKGSYIAFAIVETMWAARGLSFVVACELTVRYSAILDVPEPIASNDRLRLDLLAPVGLSLA